MSPDVAVLVLGYAVIQIARLLAADRAAQRKHEAARARAEGKT
jgi:hypothetical protein